jgi:hypothetical protein
MGLTSLTGTGGFQDASGAPLAFGTLKVQLMNDQLIGSSQICSGKEVVFNLDANGNVISGLLWGPATYIFRAYSAQGLMVWSMNVRFNLPYYYY